MKFDFAIRKKISLCEYSVCSFVALIMLEFVITETKHGFLLDRMSYLISNHSTVGIYFY